MGPVQRDPPRLNKMQAGWVDLPNAQGTKEGFLRR